MKKIFACFSLLGLSVMIATAQSRDSVSQNNGRSHSISLGFDLPAGSFSKSYMLGLGLGYSWTHHRFGKMESIPAASFGFIFHGGADHYLGKKEKIGTPPVTDTYKYDGYTYVHAYAGAMYNPSQKVNICLTAGPALGISHGHADFNIGIDLAGSIYLGQSGRFAITPNFTLMKETRSDPLYTGGIRLNFTL